ncbi:N-acetylmuramate alpha-1-phosphate uridylyltransferase MurU [Legionella fairfieldensis]|uniref:N-acetylmuramate alpha-1-phosphate uridylyltransferase MurU n=1 Tax=Legionella fairfieldensis TaxID=45064 RepID=UPI00048D80EA|nr:nucleotidyltransferase family protein [Legionella fairfieldensis]
MKTAMLLAAGRGERLKPLTEKTPKAMCPVQKKPLIEHHVEKLANSGFERVVINHAYLGGQIRRYLGKGSQWGIEICYTPEPPGGLETGGGIYNALPLLGDQPFITINADIFTDYDFGSLQIAQDIMAHLVLVRNPEHNSQGDFSLTKQGQLGNQNKKYTFAGIACYRPQAFHRCKTGRYSVVSLLHDIISQHQATGEIHQGFWADIGSLQRLQLVNTLLSTHNRWDH